MEDLIDQTLRAFRMETRISVGLPHHCLETEAPVRSNRSINVSQRRRDDFALRLHVPRRRNHHAKNFEVRH
jgi:hypothetical protein